jgi:hypothetical protein
MPSRVLLFFLSSLAVIFLKNCVPLSDPTYSLWEFGWPYTFGYATFFDANHETVVPFLPLAAVEIKTWGYVGIDIAVALIISVGTGLLAFRGQATRFTLSRIFTIFIAVGIWLTIDVAGRVEKTAISHLGFFLSVLVFLLLVGACNGYSSALARLTGTKGASN